MHLRRSDVHRVFFYRWKDLNIGCGGMSWKMFLQKIPAGAAGRHPQYSQKKYQEYVPAQYPQSLSRRHRGSRREPWPSRPCYSIGWVPALRDPCYWSFFGHPVLYPESTNKAIAIVSRISELKFGVPKVTLTCHPEAKPKDLANEKEILRFAQNDSFAVTLAHFRHFSSL